MRFYYRDLNAISVDVTAYDASWTVVDSATFPAGEGYAGFTRASADIHYVRTFAPRSTIDDAIQSRTYVDDLSFARELKSEYVHVKLQPGQFIIVLGGVRVDGRGIVIGPGGIQPVPPWNPDVRQLVAAANLFEHAELLNEPGLRKQLKTRAAGLLKASMKRLSKSR